MMRQFAALHYILLPRGEAEQKRVDDLFWNNSVSECISLCNRYVTHFDYVFLCMMKNK